MTVGTLRIRLLIREAHSLKDKRRVVKSIREQIRRKFNVAIAEVDDQDVWKSATLGVAAVGGDRRYVEGLLSQVANFLRLRRDAELVDVQTELF